jgi:septum site-determining protein MinD
MSETQDGRKGDMMDIPVHHRHFAIDLWGSTATDYIVVSTNRGEPAVMVEESRAGQATGNRTQLKDEKVPFMDLTRKNRFGSDSRS